MEGHTGSERLPSYCLGIETSGRMNKLEINVDGSAVTTDNIPVRAGQNCPMDQLSIRH